MTSLKLGRVSKMVPFESKPELSQFPMHISVIRGPIKFVIILVLNAIFSKSNSFNFSHPESIDSFGPDEAFMRQ